MPKAPSRADRFAKAMDLVSAAKEQIEELRDELQEWRDGMPENLQASAKAEALDEAITELEDCINSLDCAEGASPEFPGMY